MENPGAVLPRGVSFVRSNGYKRRKPPVKSRRGSLKGRHTRVPETGNGSGQGALQRPGGKFTYIAAAQGRITD